MQFYLPGINPLFWKQITALPDSVYNKENTQTSSAQIEQLLVTFVDKLIGTIVNVVISSKQTGTFAVQAKVVNEAGLVYIRVALPYTQNQDDIDISIIDDITKLTLERSTFSSSPIYFMYEEQAKFLHEIFEDTTQLAQNITIQGVEDGLLESRYGTFTGLAIRPEQTITQYRDQTACLWKSYQFASMEKGLVDSLKCVLGDIVIDVVRTRDTARATIFDRAQFIDTDDVFGTPVPDDYVSSVTPWPTSIVLVRDDLDDPHFYIADIDDGYLVSADALDTVINPGADNTPGSVWDNTVAERFVLLTEQAISNELLVTLGNSELDAASQITNEVVLRRPDDAVLGPIDDQLANKNILPFVTITQATIGGDPNPTTLPTENTDFTVDRLTGKITWISLIPDPGTLYTVDYHYRLDEVLSIVVKKVKPAHRSVVLIFANSTSGLPKAIEV